MILAVEVLSKSTRLGTALERSQQGRLQDEASFSDGVGVSVGRSVRAFFWRINFKNLFGTRSAESFLLREETCNWWHINKRGKLRNVIFDLKGSDEIKTYVYTFQHIYKFTHWLRGSLGFNHDWVVSM